MQADLGRQTSKEGWDTCSRGGAGHGAAAAAVGVILQIRVALVLLGDGQPQGLRPQLQTQPLCPDRVEVVVLQQLPRFGPGLQRLDAVQNELRQTPVGHTLQRLGSHPLPACFPSVWEPASKACTVGSSTEPKYKPRRGYSQTRMSGIWTGGIALQVGLSQAVCF